MAIHVFALISASSLLDCEFWSVITTGYLFLFLLTRYRVACCSWQNAEWVNETSVFMISIDLSHQKDVRKLSVEKGWIFRVPTGHLDLISLPSGNKYWMDSGAIRKDKRSSRIEFREMDSKSTHTLRVPWACKKCKVYQKLQWSQRWELTSIHIASLLVIC